MILEIKGVEYQDLKEHLDDLVMNHDLRTYKIKKVYGSLPGYWLNITVNRHIWIKTWRDTGNEIKNTTECIEKSFEEELKGMGSDNAKVRLVF